jgi:NitT/TauT family transport system substrate-binding protein
MATMDGLPFLVAADKGIYDSLGLHVNFTIFLTETDRDASFEAHKLDGIATDYTSAAVLQSKGIPLRAVMQNDGYLCLLTGRGSKLNAIKQLKGINLCTSRNAFTEYAAECVLQKAGIKLEEVNEPEINQIPLRLQMLQEGQIDATFLPDPYATIAMNSGSHSLITTEDLNIHQYTTIFSRESLKKKAESVKALLKGYNLAIDYLAKHPQSDWAGVLTNQLKVPENVIGLIVLPSYHYAQAPNVGEVNNAVAWLKSKKLVKDGYTGTELVDSSYIEKASKEEQVKMKLKKILKHHVRRKHQ